MTNKQGRPKSSARRAIEELRHLIFSGELAPGSDHLESELADRLGMSRTPVREAALTLEAQGLLELRPRKGIRILPVSAGDMREIYDVLTELESLSAERAAEKGYSQADLAELASTITDMDRALANGDRDAWADADDRFHTELERLGGNARVIAIAGTIRDQVRRARAVTLHMRPLPSRSNDDHRTVLTAISAADPATARAVHRAHREQARDMLVTLLQTYRLHRL